MTPAAGLLAPLLAPGAVAAESRWDIPGASLVGSERAAVAGAVESRRAEFTTCRHLARQALAAAGLDDAAAIPVGAHRAPIWPAGVVGSITHCLGYRGVAVARAADLAAIGIDAEPHEALPPGTRTQILTVAEDQAITALEGDAPSVAWDRISFCAKEATFKAWYPDHRSWLEFHDVVVSVDPFSLSALEVGVDAGELYLAGGFVATVRSSRTMPGRWTVRDGLILAAICMPPAAAAATSGPDRP